MGKEKLNNVEEKETAVSEAVLEKKEEFKKEFKISNMAKQPWFQVVFDAKQEFPEDVRKIIEKIAQGGGTSGAEQLRLNLVLHIWWKERFGFSFTQTQEQDKFSGLTKAAVRQERRKKKFKEKISYFEAAKQDRMRRLHVALRQLDAEEQIGEFKYVTRRQVFYSKDRGEYVISGDEEQNITVGDILSDYAWDIRYAPDFSRMQDAPREARLIARRILVNEARRDLETIYDQELTVQQPGAAGIQNIQRMLYEGKVNSADIGPVAEIMARETLARISADHNFGFAVLRANAIEDGLYKYDFKILAKEHRRGVEVEDEKNFQKRLKSLGIQFKKGMHSKLYMILEAKQKYGAEIPVADIVLIKIHSDEFQNSFNAWVRLGKPSGGPEQFLSPELKTDLLQRATQGIVTIKQEALEHLFEKRKSKKDL